MNVHISRNGAVVAQVPLEKLQQALTAGSITSEDYAWHEGLMEWTTVSAVLADSPSFANESQTSKATKKTKTPKEKKAPVPKHDWRQDPATLAQLKLLADLGVVAKIGVTKKGAASDLISQRLATQKRRDWRAEQENETTLRNDYPVHSLRLDILKLREEIRAVEIQRKAQKSFIAERKKELSALEKKLSAGKDEEEGELLENEITETLGELKSLEEELSDSASDMEDWRQELKTAETRRVGFWKATFQSDWFTPDDEMDLENLTEIIDRLYASHGHPYKVPGNKQIADVLAALDERLKDWDKCDFGYFYGTLRESFPSLLRTAASKSKRSAPAGTRRQGCLVFVVAGGIAYCILHLMH